MKRVSGGIHFLRTGLAFLSMVAVVGTQAAPVPGTLRWRISVPGFAGTSAAVGPEGSIYVGSTDGTISRLNPATGIRTPVFTGRSSILATPTVLPDSTLIFSNVDGRVSRIRTADGGRLWDTLASDEIRCTAAAGPRGVFFGDYAGFVAGIGLDSGQREVRFSTDHLINSSPAVGVDGTVYFGSFDGHLYALSASGGGLRWSFNTGGPVLSSPAIASDGTVVWGSDDGKLYAAEGASGALKWSAALSGPVRSSPAIDSTGRIFVGSTDGRLYAINGVDGGILWTFPTGAAIRSSPAVLDSQTVVFGSDRLWAVDTGSGRARWSWDAGHPVDASPAIGADGSIVVGPDNNEVFSVEGGADLDRGPWPKFHRNRGNDGTADRPYLPNVMSLGSSPRPAGNVMVRLRVNPNGTATRTWFEFGVNADYGLRTAEQVIPAGIETLEITQSLTLLEPGRRYHYRAVAANSRGLSVGADRPANAGPPTSIPMLRMVAVSADSVILAIALPAGTSGVLESMDGRIGTAWIPGSNLVGDGAEHEIRLPHGESPAQWYRVRSF